ncbi:MAG TPA: PDZ domain-containing protein, partial [Planctomycetaceae bacterium]|nr:PDZ domain-containing protein [Planctomycetaceae bacterium]
RKAYAFLIAFIVACLAAADLSAQPDARLEALEERAFQEAAVLVAPSLVRIDTVGGIEQLSDEVTAAGATTGLVVSPDGYLVSSAFHFASKPASILVTLADGRRFSAEQVATDRQRMVTLLRIDAANLTVPTAAPRDSFHVGQWTIALGRTFETDGPSLSVGIVSALDRVWGKAIQTDAKLSPVNYGGALADAQGRVMGVIVPLSPHESGETAGVEWYDSGIGFAVPLVDVLAVLDRLKAGDDLKPGLLGITFKGKDLNAPDVLIERVRFDSPAEKAGLKAGDRITSVDGRPVTRMAQLRQVLGRKYADDVVRLEVRRDDNTARIEVKLVGELPPFAAGYLGILPERHATAPGATVRVVLPGSPAEQAGLKSRDRIVNWNDADIADADALADQIGRLRPGATGKLVVRRGEQEVSVTATLAAAPVSVPDEVTAESPATGETPAEFATLKTGHLAETLAGHDRPYWLFVPESVKSGRPHGLMVFLHPGLDSMEMAMLSAWKPECERRGVIIVAPKTDNPAGWAPNDLEFVNDCVAKARETYRIAPSRIWMHAVGNATGVGLASVFRQRAMYRGAALVNPPPLGKLPENDPEHRLQFHLSTAYGTPDATKLERSVKSLRESGYPAVLMTVPSSDGHKLSDGLVGQLARWAECLDRI